jgi:hypothetical protein
LCSKQSKAYSVGNEEVNVCVGEATPESGEAALRVLNRAIEDYQKMNIYVPENYFS